MKQNLTPAGRAALQRQLDSPGNFINPDEEILEKMMQAKAVSFWEGTVMEVSCAGALLREGVRALHPDPGWEVTGAAMMVIADRTAEDGVSLGMVEDLSALVLDAFAGSAFTFGTAFSDLDIGALRLVLAASCEPVRAPERLTRLSLGTLTLLIGGTRGERERFLGEFTGFSAFITELLLSVSDGETQALRSRWREMPRLAVSEVQLMDGEERTSQEFADLLLYRFHNDLPTELAMQYLPICFANWFPLEQMRRDTPAPPPEEQW